MNKLLLLLVFIPLLGFSTDPGDRTGNGGDFVRSSFILEGHRTLKLLDSTREGQAFALEYNLSTASLAEILNTSVIEVTEDRLFDRFGNEVDALGERFKITLNKARWLKLFDSNVDLRVLVFHEILRAADINDDDYIISNHLPIDALKDAYMDLKKEFAAAVVSEEQQLRIFFSNVGNQNKTWNCLFAAQDSVHTLQTNSSIQMEMNSHLNFINKLTQIKIITKMSLNDNITQFANIPAFRPLIKTKHALKFVSRRTLLFHFNEIIYGKCQLN